MSDPLLRGAGAYFFEGSSVGCLLVHGMGSTPHQLRSLGNYLGRQGLTVLGLRLPGHGTSLDDLEQTTARGWLEAVEQGIVRLRQSCTHVFLVGNSLGGVLALSVAVSHGSELAGLVTISTPVSSTPLIQLLQDPSVPDRFERPGLAELLCTDPRVGAFQYSRTSKKVLAQAYEVLKRNQLDLPRITIPALVIASVTDRLAPVENAHYLVSHLGSSDVTLLTLKDSGHLPTLDHDQERLAVAVLSFIEERVETSASGRSQRSA